MHFNKVLDVWRKEPNDPDQKRPVRFEAEPGTVTR